MTDSDQKLNSQSNILSPDELLHKLSKLSSSKGKHLKLCELHTHLMGMGNHDFWINEILMDSAKLPPNRKFLSDENVRFKLGPLIWDSENSTWFHSNEAAIFFSDMENNHKENII